jgi:glycosyltransferase involved in cell wall biosynthesis
VFGGFEIQMLSAIDASREAGVDIAPLDVWSRDGDFDILQLWGLEDAHLPAVTWGRRTGKRIVMSVLLPYLTPKAFARHLGGYLLGFKRFQRKILRLVDRLVVVNEDQAKTAEKLLGFSGDKISIVPNIVEDIYFDGDERAVGNFDFGVENYLICTGNICSRKNQLALAQAAIKEDIPLLIVGHPTAGEATYADALSKLVEKSAKIRWVPGLSAHSPELWVAYRKSAGFVLVSVNETQPISALEAAAMGKPLLLSNSRWARHSFYRGASLVNPFSLESVRRGMRHMIDQADRLRVRPEELERCRRHNVGEAYAKIYAQTMMETF